MIQRLRQAGVRVPNDADARQSIYFTAYAKQSGIGLSTNTALSKALEIAADCNARWELGLPFASP